MDQNNRLPKTPEELRRAIVSGAAQPVFNINVSTNQNPVRLSFSQRCAWIDLDADTAEKLGTKLLEEAAKIRKAGS